MNNDIIYTNSDIELRQMPKIHDMIDAHAYHSSRVTWPLELMYIRTDGEPIPLKEVVAEKFPCHNLGMFTVEQGDYLVDINTEMYNRHKGTIDDLDREDIPSLIISSTKDMEFAHIDGYEGKAILFAIPSVFQGWKTQIRDTEMAVARNPLRLFPLFSYDPRRYRLPDEKSTVDNKGCETWDKPFARIVGCKDSVNGMKKIWLGFCMNPSFGFRPFDEFCEHLPKFYKKCMDDNIPILANCAPVGVTAREANRYKVFDAGKTGERIKQSGSRKLPNSQNALCSSMYGGRESVIEDVNLDYFYRNYGHPRNWIPVLKSFPELRLCLSGFGGSREWQHLAMQTWATKDDNDDQLPYREWIRCIIKLTRYKNVYADISGLDISNPSVWSVLREMLNRIQRGDEEFKHLKYKLIFGSGWYLSHLMDMNTTYSNYCHDFKVLFDGVGKSGKFWERVSLVNPWNFYALSSDKINKMHDELAEMASEDRGVNDGLLKKMMGVFNGSDEGEGLVKYISGCNDKDPIGELKVLDEGDEDLAADEEMYDVLLITSDAVGERELALKTAKGLISRKYASAIPQNERVKEGQLDCSGFVRYSIMQNPAIGDPFVGSVGNGVTRIMGVSRKVKLNDIRDGDLVVIKSGNNENGHIGFVKDIKRDENGNVIEYTMLHAEAAWTNSSNGLSGGGTINEATIVVGSERGYARSKYKHRFYQWDTPKTSIVRGN